MRDADTFPAPELGGLIVTAIAEATGRAVIRYSVFAEMGSSIEVAAVLNVVGHAAVLDGAATLKAICAAIHQATGVDAIASPARVVLRDCIEVTAWLQHDGSLIFAICDPSQADGGRG